MLTLWWIGDNIGAYRNRLGGIRMNLAIVLRAPGLLFRQPDHFENFDDWPFLWGQNEGTIAGNTQYIIFGSALKDAVNKNKK